MDKCRGNGTHARSGTGPDPADTARRFLGRAGIARSGELEAAGVSRAQVSRLVSRGVIERVSRGLYRLPGTPRSGQQDLAAAVLRVPGGVVCLLSALRFHDLTTQNPFEVWLAIGRKAWRPRVEHPPLRLVHLSEPALHAGVEEHDIDGVAVPVFSAAKTVADCFKFRNKIGSDVAIEALRDFRRLYPKELDILWKYAELNRVTRVLGPYLESLA